MTNSSTKWILASSFAIAALGFLVPFWPLSVAGILLASFSGRWIFAVAMGALFDVAYGAPMGTMHLLFFPFTLLAIAGALGRIVSLKYLFDKRTPDTL